MTGKTVLRKIAAALCAAMLTGSVPLCAAAEAVVQTAPQYTKISVSVEAKGNAVTVVASNTSGEPLSVVLDGVSYEMDGNEHTFFRVSDGRHTVQVRYSASGTGEYASKEVTVEVGGRQSGRDAASTGNENRRKDRNAGSRDETPAQQEQTEQQQTEQQQTEQQQTEQQQTEQQQTEQQQTEQQQTEQQQTEQSGRQNRDQRGRSEDRNSNRDKNNQENNQENTSENKPDQEGGRGNNGVDLIVPPTGGNQGNGGVDLIVPPTGGNQGNGGVDLIVPPTGGNQGNGGVDLIVPPAGGNQGNGENGTDAVKAFTILPVVTDGVISVVVDGASEREIEVKLSDRRNRELASASIIGSGLVRLGAFSSGTYTVRAQYVTPVQGENGSYDYKTVTAEAVVPRGEKGEPDSGKPVDIQATVEKGRDYIIITVTEAADREMLVSVEGLSDKQISKGGSVRYDGLTPGETYHIEIDYVQLLEGAARFTQSVTLERRQNLREISIDAVKPGVNMLTVSGRAEEGKQLIITTTPAAAGDVYAMAGKDGRYSAQIACSADTYTAVTVRYVADDAKKAVKKGSWVVSASEGRPTLSVDGIDTTSTTVVAKTTPGILVEIRTSDYTNRATAGEDGVVRFSLPHTYASGQKIDFVVYYGRHNRRSFTQTETVAEAAHLNTLKYGDRGDAVKKLTVRLKALGYPVSETSRYGSEVREAVRLFEKANGLDADGVADARMQRVLYSVSAIAYNTNRYPTLVRGDKGMDLIYKLQQRLKDLGYYTIKVDGIFGSGTQRAVRLFQQVNGLSVTGKADHATQALLYSSAAKPIGSMAGDSYETLSRSTSYKSKVVTLQRRLKALGYYTGSIDGYFGSLTYRAVRNFQNRNGLSVTGVADPYTQQVLYSSAAKAASGHTVPTTGEYRLLYWGCRGDSVVRLQQALINAGYKSIVRTADGIFGQWTYDAVRAYQKDHGLLVDGIAGKNTQNSLYGTNY